MKQFDPSEALAQGDIIWLNLNPTKGREQRGKRPCIILGKKIPFMTNIISIAPITTKSKPFPFHVPLPDGLQTTGVILIEQHKTVDVVAKGFEFIEKAPGDLVEQCVALVKLMY